MCQPGPGFNEVGNMCHVIFSKLSCQEKAIIGQEAEIKSRKIFNNNLIREKKNQWNPPFSQKVCNKRTKRTIYIWIQLCRGEMTSKGGGGVQTKSKSDSALQIWQELLLAFRIMRYLLITA